MNELCLTGANPWEEHLSTCMCFAWVHFSVYDCVRMATDGYKHVHEFVYLGQRNFTCTLVCWRASGEEMLSRKVVCWKMLALIPSQLTIKKCMWDRPLPQVLKPSTQPAALICLTCLFKPQSRLTSTCTFVYTSMWININWRSKLGAKWTSLTLFP